MEPDLDVVDAEGRFLPDLALHAVNPSSVFVFFVPLFLCVIPFVLSPGLIVSP